MIATTTFSGRDLRSLGHWRVCPWEIALYGLGRDWRRAQVRFSRDFVPAPFKGRTIWTRYYAPAEFEKVVERAGFTTLSLRALGVLVPPPYLSGFARRHPKWIELLQRLEVRSPTRESVGGETAFSS